MVSLVGVSLTSVQRNQKREIQDEKKRERKLLANPMLGNICESHKRRWFLCVRTCVCVSDKVTSSPGSTLT